MHACVRLSVCLMHTIFHFVYRFWEFYQIYSVGALGDKYIWLGLYFRSKGQRSRSHQIEQKFGPFSHHRTLLNGDSLNWFRFWMCYGWFIFDKMSSKGLILKSQPDQIWSKRRSRPRRVLCSLYTALSCVRGSITNPVMLIQTTVFLKDFSIGTTNSSLQPKNHITVPWWTLHQTILGTCGTPQITFSAVDRQIYILRLYPFLL